MGANQGRPSDAKRKSKKAKGKEADAAHHDAKAAGRHPTASPPVVSRASSGDPAARAAVPADHAAPQTKPHAGPAVAPAAAAVVDPHDEHAHPFHAPLDHVREEERPLQELCAATHFDMTTLRKLQILFSDIAESAIADGFVDGNELTDAMGLKSSCLLARTICRVFDITQKKSIDFAQWVKTISALCPEASLEEKIHFSFSLYDLNGDGFVDVEELQAMLEAAVKDENVLNLSDAEVAEWCAHTLSQVDRDGDGRVDYEEYRSMVSASTKFLESFTLDIQEMCSSFRFASRKSTEKLTAAEQDQRLHWFRARQRQHSQSGNSSHPDDSSNSEHHPKSAVKAPGASATAGNVAAPSGAVAPAGAVAKLKSNSREGGHTTPPYGGSATLKTGSGSYKPIIVTTPAPASSLAQSVPASAIAAAAAGSSQAVSASSHGKGMHVVLGPLHETEADGSAAAAAAALAASPSTVLSTPGMGASPTFHDAEPSPSPSAPNFTDSPAEREHAHFSSHASATQHSDTATATATAAGALAGTTETVTISSVAFSLASSSSTSAAAAAAAAPSDEDGAAGHASTSRRGSTGAVQTEADAAAAAGLAASPMRRQQSAPLSSGAHSIHYVSSRTPLHLLKQASIDTLAHSDEEVEEMEISPLEGSKHANEGAAAQQQH